MVSPVPAGASMRPDPISSPRPKGPEEVKVLTINVKAFQGSDGGTVDQRAFDAIERYIEDVDADVVLFQELDDGTVRSGRTNQLAEIGRRVGATDTQFAKAIPHDDGDYGVGMLTRNGFSIKDAPGGGNASQRVELPKSTAKGADHEQRVALVAPIVAPGGKEFTAVSTHVTVDGPGRGAQIDRIQAIVDDARGGRANRDAELADDMPTAVVIGGDFNAKRGPTEDHLTRGVTHVADHSGVGDTKIDHVYVSDDIRVKDARLDGARTIREDWKPFGIGDLKMTDHPALLATLELR